MPFALTADFQRRRRDDHKNFFCPNGHPQHYTGASEAQELRRELDRAQSRLLRQEQRAEKAEHARDQIQKAHRKMRQRVVNGVCPCCNRSFENLRMHMQSQHPDFGKEQTLVALRQAFGMTQQSVASEAGTNATYISNYERGKPIPVDARDAIESWMEVNGAAA